MSRETLTAFKESARERFCKRVMNAFCAEGYLLPDTEGILSNLLELSKQADSIYLKSEATQYRYLMLCVLLEQEHHKIKILHEALQQLPKKEELRLAYLDEQIDRQRELI